MNEKPYTSYDKWVVAFMAAILYMILASPVFFTALSKLKIPVLDGQSVTILGLLIGGVTFMLFTRMLIR